MQCHERKGKYYEDAHFMTNHPSVIQRTLISMNPEKSLFQNIKCVSRQENKMKSHPDLVILVRVYCNCFVFDTVRNPKCVCIDEWYIRGFLCEGFLACASCKRDCVV